AAALNLVESGLLVGTQRCRLDRRRRLSEHIGQAINKLVLPANGRVNGWALRRWGWCDRCRLGNRQLSRWILVDHAEVQAVELRLNRRKRGVEPFIALGIGGEANSDQLA